MKLSKIIVIAFLGAINTVNAQQEAQFTQYMDNMLYYNPAYAGSRDALNINVLHRQQWVGIKGAPITQTLSIHSPLKYESFGLGFSMMHDRVGPMNQTWLNADASYSLRFKKHKGRLSFGINGGINIVNADLTSLYTPDPNDPQLARNYRNEILPNIGAGIYYHSKQWFAGFAIPRIAQTNSGLSDIKYQDQRHYYLTVGGYFNVNRMLKIRPSTMIKITENAPLAIDLTTSFIFYDKVWLGANYRVLESAGAHLQYQFTPQFKFGYSFDISTSAIVRENYATHEIMLSYDFLFRKKSITSPRYF